MDNSKLFFQLYFDRMPQPVTGPVTEALLHLVDKVNVAGATMVISDTFIPIVLKMCTLEADETQSIKDECNSGGKRHHIGAQ